MRLKAILICVVCTAVSGYATGADPTMTIAAQGTTNANNLASVGFDLTNLGTGQKFQATNWLNSMSIGGANVNVPGCTLSSSNAGASGLIGAPLNVAPGTYSVTIKVKLNDGTFVTKTSNVEFKKSAGGE